MLKKLVGLALIIGLAGTLVACNREPKPSKEGVWVIVKEKLTQASIFSVDMDFTAEGLSLYYFQPDPTIVVRNKDFYFITYGDFKPNGLRFYRRVNGKYELDANKDVSGALVTNLMKGETNMYKCRFSQDLDPGYYTLDMVTSKKAQRSVAFEVQ